MSTSHRRAFIFLLSSQHMRRSSSKHNSPTSNSRSNPKSKTMKNSCGNCTSIVVFFSVSKMHCTSFSSHPCMAKSLLCRCSNNIEVQWLFNFICGVMNGGPQVRAVFLYCHPDYSSCPANAIPMGQATWAMCAAIKNYNLKPHCLL